MKNFNFTEEQIKMLKEACLCVMALMRNGNEADKAVAVKYKTLYDYLNS